MLDSRHHIRVLLVVALCAIIAACSGTPDKPNPKKGGGNSGATAAGHNAPKPSSKYSLPGFPAFVADGRLWVFKKGSKELAGFKKTGEPAKRVTRIGAGPNDCTIMAVDGTVIDAYMAAYRHGNRFTVIEDDGRLWVFRTGSAELAGFRAKGEPAKRITRVGAGPGEKTIMSSEGEIIDEFMAAYHYGKPGFTVFEEDGRLWIFKNGSKELEGFRKVGEPAKRVTRVGAGPRGMTVMAADTATLDAYGAY